MFFIAVQVHKGQQKKDPCERMLGIAVVFIVFHPLIVAFNYVGENRDKRYWHGALLPPGIQPYFIPLFFVVEYWISIVALAGTIVSVMFLVCYFNCAPQWLQLLM